MKRGQIPKYSSRTTALGKRFELEVQLRKKADPFFSKAEASREMGYSFPTTLYAILANVPGRAGEKSLGRVEAWLKESEKWRQVRS